MFDSDTQGFYKSEQQESSIMRRSFNPHALQRSAPLLHVGAVYHHEFQSTRPIRGATTLDDLRGSGSLVSIHAPHAGRDPQDNWGARAAARFNPRAPCGARPRVHFRNIADLRVSIHAPHAGRDLLRRRCALLCGEFQSTRPMRGATSGGNRQGKNRQVSIHAPHAGRDLLSGRDVSEGTRFNPRAPCGARLRRSMPRSSRGRFNPRAPCGARRDA